MTALEGMRILDMTQYEAGTSCTQALAWLGADVVKVEQPVTGDPGRGRARGAERDREYFLAWNSNKRSVTIDLRNPAGRELLLEMVPKYDVFVENYGPGVVEKLDIGYDVMQSIHPSIIYARIKGFGTSGPYADYKCMDMVAQSASGAFSITGSPDGPPMRPGPTMGDAGTGVQAALLIAAAYAQQQRTGEGQLIELSMQEAMTYYLRTAVSFTDFGAKAAQRAGNGQNPFSALYPCAPGGPNDYVFIMAVNPRMWAAVSEVIGQPGLLDDPRFASADLRIENRVALFETIAAWTRQHSKDEAMKTLADAGVPASSVFETSDLFTDPHLRAREFIKEVDHPQYGTVQMMRWPGRLSKSEVEIEPAPLLGAHTDEVLAEDLGIDADKIEHLKESGAIGGSNP